MSNEKATKATFALLTIVGGLAWLITALNSLLTSWTNGQPWIQGLVGIVTLIAGYMLLGKSMTWRWKALFIAGFLIGAYHVNQLMTWLSGWLAIVISVLGILLGIWVLAIKK